MANWTDKQKEAIYDRGNSLLVSAAAGSGKTAVLVERIKTLIKEGASLDRMLIVTFTKAAAAEMRERLRRELGEELSSCSEDVKDHINKQLRLIGRAEICTFDSFAVRLCRTYYQVIGKDPDLKICDNYKSSILKTEAMEELFKSHYSMGDEDFKYFLDRYSSSRNDKNARDMILALYGYTDTLPDPDSFLDDPMFSPEKLLEEAGSMLALILEKSMAYCTLLINIFEANSMTKCAGIIKTLWSDLGSFLDSLRSGYTESSIAAVFEYSFPRLSVGKEEKQKLDAMEDLKKEYLEKCIKDPIKNFRKQYGQLSLERLKDEHERLAKPVSILCSLTKEFSRIYSRTKSEAGLMDFSDGEHFALKILQNEDVRTECKEKYSYIFVDEYQDTNPLQESLIESISSGNNVFTVGDVKQSIYRFRHADPSLFLKRYAEYKAGKEDCKVIDLSNNFRSKGTVIDFVNRLFEKLMTKESCGMEYDENAALYEGVPYEGPRSYEPKLYIADTKDAEDSDPLIEELKKDEIEAFMAADIIEEYHGKLIDDGKKGERPLAYKDMTVLLRSAKNKAEIYYDILTKRGIPVYLERNEGYFDTPEIQICVNLLRIIDDIRQDVPLISVLHFPVFGFSANDLSSIRIEAKKSEKRCRSFYDALKFCSTDGPKGLKERCSEFLEKIDLWRMKASAMPLGDFVFELLSSSGIFIFAAGLSSGEQRLANLRALVDKASEFEKTSTGGIFSFISYVDAISGDDSKVSTGQSGMVTEEDDVVRIMTVHKSKGLEFPFVLFAGCGSSIFGSRKTGRAVYSKELGTSMVLSQPKTFSYVKPSSFAIIDAKKKEAELAEEIRVLYVAITRAKDIFIMTASGKDAGKMVSKRDIYSVRTSDCSSFAEMALPSFDASNVEVKYKDSFKLSSFEKAEYEMKELKERLRTGLSYSEDELEGGLSTKEIKRRLEFDYSGPKEEKEKRKYSVSELAAEGHKEGIDEIFKEDAVPVPRFLLGKAKLSSAAVGTAYHKVMEHIPFNMDYASADAVSKFTETLLEKGIMTKDEKDSIDPAKIADFFSSDMGTLVCSCDVLKKETPFVIKHSYEGREILVQGTIDCWFEKDGKLYLLDYKTNYINIRNKEKELEKLKKIYEPQLALYKEALETVSGKKVSGSYLYLFSAGEYISLGDDL